MKPSSPLSNDDYPVENPDFEGSPEYVQSLARGLDIIRAFDAEHPEMSLAGVADRTGYSRAVVRRFLLTLQHLGFVQSDGRRFRPTPKMLELGYSYLSSLNASDLVLPLMERLTKTVEESCSLAVLSGDDIVYVLRVPVRKVMAVGLGVGARLPAYATSMGRILLAAQPPEGQARRLDRKPLKRLTPHTLVDPAALRAELAKVTHQGWAMNEQELELGLCSLAVPIHHRGKVVAALNVGMRWHEGARKDLQGRILPELRAAAGSIEEAIRTLPTFG